MTTLEPIRITTNQADIMQSFAKAVEPLAGHVSVLPNLAVMNACWHNSKRRGGDGTALLSVAADDMCIWTCYRIGQYDLILIDAGTGESFEIDPRDEDDAADLIEQFGQEIAEVVREHIAD